MQQKSFDFYCRDNLQAGRGYAEHDTLVTALLPPAVHVSDYASVKRVSLVFEDSLEERPCMTSSDAVKAFFKRYWQRHPGNDQERFVVTCLDTKNRVQSVVVITVGTLDGSLGHPREVFKPVVIEGSSFVVFSLNHPSGDLSPSREDIRVTALLTTAGELIGIDVLNHIIYGDRTAIVLCICEQ